MPVRFGPPLSAVAAGEPAVSMAFRLTITSGTGEDRRFQVRSARLTTAPSEPPHMHVECKFQHAHQRGQAYTAVSGYELLVG